MAGPLDHRSRRGVDARACATDPVVADDQVRPGWASAELPPSDLLAAVAAELAAVDVASPLVDARLLIEAATSDDDINRARLDAMVARRVAREPLQVIIGVAHFRHLSLGTASGVFVPRPETEVVAGIAIDAALASVNGPARVVDVCTGSGTIALAVAAEVPGVQVVATEIDADALALARVNLEALVERTPTVHTSWRVGDTLAPHATVRLAAGKLLDPVDRSWRGVVDVLVANPPYLPASDRGSWQPEVAKHDPDQSLVGGVDGHEVVDLLLVEAAQWLRPGGMVVIEIDDRRGEDAVAVAAAAGLVDGRVVKDLTGRDRAVVARRPGRARLGTVSAQWTGPWHDGGDS